MVPTRAGRARHRLHRPAGNRRIQSSGLPDERGRAHVVRSRRVSPRPVSYMSAGGRGQGQPSSVYDRAGGGRRRRRAALLGIRPDQPVGRLIRIAGGPGVPDSP